MKLCLVNPDKEAVDPPLGLCYIASYLREYGGFNDIVIVDKENELKKIEKEKPDLVGISVFTKDFNMSNELARKIKSRFDIPVLIGGSHISNMPEHLPHTNFDIGILGEGEQTMLELIQLYEKYGKFSSTMLKNIKGIIFKNNSSFKITGSRPLIEPVDKIPYPAKDLIKMKEHYLLPRASFFPGQLVVVDGISTSRGCPYNCVFCASGSKRIRLHSADYVVGEIKEIVEKYNIHHICLWDDLFTINKNRLQEIVQLLKQEGLKDKIEFLVNGRADLLNREICQLLKEMGVTRISIGFESGSEQILDYLKKNTVTVQQNYQALRLCKEFGIKVHGFFIIGSPMETEEDLKRTLKLAKDPDMDTFVTFQLTPLPNTDVWRYAKEKGIIKGEFKLNPMFQTIIGFRPELVMTDYISKEKLKKWYDLFKKEEEKNYKKIGFKLRYLKYLINFRFLSRVITNPKRILSYFKFAK